MNQEKHKQNLQFSIYIHVPFCANICDYCAFYHELVNKQKIEQYMQCLEQEISYFQTKQNANTIYFGGGTPIILSVDNIYQTGKLCKNFINEQLQEWTVEIAPTATTKDKLIALKKIGVSRLSIGVQSFNEKILKILGRKQSTKAVITTYEIARDIGFNNIGFDLIFSIPGQTINDWQKDIEMAIELQPEHISTYNLTFEGESKIVDKKNLCEMSENSENISSDFCLFTWDFLEQHGYKQYEISNFAKNGFESIHNKNTWQMQEWIGFGPSASSQINMKRHTNVSSLSLWADGILKRQPNLCDVCDLTDDTLAVDSIIFGLRMNNGVDLRNLQQRFQHFDFSVFDKLIEQLVDENLSVFSNEKLSLTTTGRLVADAIAAEFIART